MSQGETSRGPAPLCSSKHSHLLTDALACTASETSGHLLYNIYFTCSTADMQLQLMKQEMTRLSVCTSNNSSAQHVSFPQVNHAVNSNFKKNLIADILPHLFSFFFHFPMLFLASFLCLSSRFSNRRFILFSVCLFVIFLSKCIYHSITRTDYSTDK